MPTGESIACEQTDGSDLPVVMNLEPVRDGSVLRFGRVRIADLFLAQRPPSGVTAQRQWIADRCDRRPPHSRVRGRRRKRRG